MDEREKTSARLGLNLFNFLAIYFTVLIILLLIVRKTSDNPFNLYISIMWSVYTPAAVLGLMGAIKSRKLESLSMEAKCDSKLHIVIPTVGTFGVMKALKRVISSIYDYCPDFFKNFTVDIVVDENSPAIENIYALVSNRSGSRIIVVPKDFHCRNGTITKARALEYAREMRSLSGEAGQDEFIYHLDDDTSVSRETIWSIADFINNRSDRYDLAQGVLTFPHDLSTSYLSKIADSVRPSDDLTRFYFFTGVLHAPLAGLHGEHLIVRSSVEDTIGWDFGLTKVEDSFFGLEFARKFGRRSSFLPSRVMDSSPQSLKDLIKQRRRWYCGIMSLVFTRKNIGRTRFPLIAYAILTLFSPMQYILVILLISALLSTKALPVSLAFLPVWSFNFAYQLWLYEEGYKINRGTDSGLSYRKRLRRVMVMPLIYVSGTIEAMAVALGVVDFIKRNHSFEVIEKPI